MFLIAGESSCTIEKPHRHRENSAEKDQHLLGAEFWTFFLTTILQCPGNAVEIKVRLHNCLMPLPTSKKKINISPLTQKQHMLLTADSHILQRGLTLSCGNCLSTATRNFSLQLGEF